MSEYYGQPIYKESILYKILYGVLYGILLGSILCIMWFLWAAFIYRWSTDRIGGNMLKKYKSRNSNLLKDNEYYSYSNVHISSDRSTASCNIDKKDKISQAIFATDIIGVLLTTDSTSCLPIDITCLIV